MKPDDFESTLRCQPIQALPREWRTEILCPAAAPQPSGTVKVPRTWWRDLLWPCPQAWAGLAAVWMVIAGLNWMTHRSEEGRPLQARRELTEAERIAYLEQQRLLATFLEPQREVIPPAPAENRHAPRSENRMRPDAGQRETI